MNEPPQSSRGLSPILMIFIISALLGLLAAVGMLLSESGNSSQSTVPNTVQVAQPNSIMGERAQDFQLTSITGELVTLAQFRGRPVFINLWWTGCPPCVREFPVFQQFMEEQGTEGAVIIAINQGEELAPVRQFMQDLGVTDVVVLLDPDMQISRSIPYNFFPTTYLLDGEGVVRQRRIGEITLDELYIFLESIQEEDEIAG